MSGQAPQSGWHSDEQRHRAIERRYWLFSSLLSSAVAIGAILSAIFAFGAVRAGQASADAGWEAATQANRQSKIAEQQLVQSQSSSRPYVIAQISKDQVSVAELSGDSAAGLTNEYTARLRFTNFGTTPAIIKHIEGAITVALPSDNPGYTAEHMTELVLSQGQSTDVIPLSRKASREEAMNAVVGSGSVYVIGKVIYTGISGQLMTSAFCYRWPLRSRGRETQLVQAYGSGCTNHND